MELSRHASSPTSVSLFFNAITTLVLLALANGVARKLAPRWALAPRELVFTYILVALGSGMAGIDMLCCLPSMMAYPHQYATPENRWAETLLPLLPADLLVSDPASLRAFWQGGTPLLSPGMLGPWVRPTMLWMGFTAGLALLWISLTVLFSPRWMESERLTYPISQLPADICLRPRRLTVDPLCIIGFAVAASIDALNGLHQLKPAWPWIPVKAHAIPTFVIGAQILDKPWNAIGPVTLSFYPFAIGLGLLLPTRLSLSCWVFYVLIKLQHVAVNQAGSWTSEGLPYTREQSVGAFLGLIGFSLFLGRRYLLAFARDAVHGSPAAGRPLAPRTTVALGGLGVAILTAFSLHAGMSWAFTLGFFAIYSLLCLSFTRIRAEMGVPAHELHMVSPGQCLVRWFGSRAVGESNLAASTVYFWFNRAYRSHPMPHLAEGLKLAERSGLSQRGLLGWAFSAMLLGSFACMASCLHMHYQEGSLARFGPFNHDTWIAQVPYGEMATLLDAPTGPNAHMALASLAGAVIAFVAMAGYTFVPWWPLHPVGYAVSNAWAADNMWFSILVAWCIKFVVERYGGAESLRRLSSLAYGLILGDFLAGSFWSIWGIVKNVVSYRIWP